MSDLVHPGDDQTASVALDTPTVGQLPDRLLVKRLEETAEVAFLGDMGEITQGYAAIVMKAAASRLAMLTGDDANRYRKQAVVAVVAEALSLAMAPSCTPYHATGADHRRYCEKLARAVLDALADGPLEASHETSPNNGLNTGDGNE